MIVTPLIPTDTGPIGPTPFGRSDRISVSRIAAMIELDQVIMDCSNVTGDDDQSIAVANRTVTLTRALIENLPDGIDNPTIGVEPDGMLTLEWYRSPGRVLNVSVDPTGTLHYAGLYGSSRKYGSMPILDRVPTELLQLIQDL